MDERPSPDYINRVLLRDARAPGGGLLCFSAGVLWGLWPFA